MLKKICFFVFAVCIFSCSIHAYANDSSGAINFYDMQEKGTYNVSNTSVYSIDSSRFPSRGDVICTSVKEKVGVTLSDSFEKPLSTGKVKISFDFYIDENYIGFPEFYLAMANMDPLDLSKLWNSSPTFYPNPDGTVKYYGGSGSSGAIWDINDTGKTLEKGKWYTVDNIVNFDEKGKIQGYMDGEKLYEVTGASSITGLILIVSGKDISNGKMYFDNIVASEVKDDLSASFVYGEEDTVVFEFTQPILAENAKDVKAVNILTGKETEICDIKQISSNRIGYTMPRDLPYTEYQFTFGENNISGFGAHITGSIKVNGTVGITDEYKEAVPAEAVLLEDDFDSYSPMQHAAAAWTLDSNIWTRTGESMWGMGPIIDDNNRLQIQAFYGDKGYECGVKGKLLDTPKKDGSVIVSYDLSFDEYDPDEENAVRFDIMSGNKTFPLLDVKAESISVYPTQTVGEIPDVLSQVTKQNNSVALNYKITLNFDTGKISIKIGDTEVPDITMNDDLKDAGISDIVFMGCRNVENGSEEECNCALIDNFCAVRTYLESIYYPAISGVRFIDDDENENTLLDVISPLTPKIRLKFSKPMDETQLSQISITNSQDNISYTGQWDDKTNVYEMLIPERKLMVKSDHTLHIPGDICDLDNLTLVKEYEYTFKVGSNTRSTNITYINEFIEQGDIQGIASLLENDPDNLGIVSDAYAVADKVELANSIIDYSNGDAIADTDDTVKALQKLVLIECANNYRTSNLWDKDLSYGICDPRLVAIFEERYGEYVTEQISGKDFSVNELDEFDVALRNAIILADVNYADGKEQLKRVIDDFETEIGGGDRLNLTNEKYTAVYKHGTFNSINELKKFIRDYVPDSNNTGDNGSSGSKSTKNTSFVSGNITFEKQKEESKEEVPIFSDIKDYPWAEEAIRKLFAKGAISGRGNGLFAPGESVLREEAAKIIVEAFKFYTKGIISFKDVNEDDWFYPYIVRAYSSDVVSGIDEYEFGTGQKILRQDLAVMVYNALNAAKALKDIEISDELFVDDTDISDYARQAVYYLKAAGIVSGDDNKSFLPKKHVSRAETAKIVYFAIQCLK